MGADLFMMYFMVRTLNMPEETHEHLSWRQKFEIDTT
jgi:hypothetical protein